MYVTVCIKKNHVCYAQKPTLEMLCLVNMCRFYYLLLSVKPRGSTAFGQYYLLVIYPPRFGWENKPLVGLRIHCMYTACKHFMYTHTAQQLVSLLCTPHIPPLHGNVCVASRL